VFVELTHASAGTLSTPRLDQAGGKFAQKGKIATEKSSRGVNAIFIEPRSSRDLRAKIHQ